MSRLVSADGAGFYLPPAQLRDPSF